MASPKDGSGSKSRATPRTQGRPKRTDAAVGAQTLIDLTCELLDKVQPSTITLSMVARHAKVDPALIRYYFGDRKTLLRMAAAKLTSQLQAAGMPAAAEANASPSQKIAARIATQLAFRVEHPHYHRLMLEEVASADDEESGDYFDAQVGFAAGRYARYVKAGIEDGSLRDIDEGFLYLAVIGLCDVFVTAGPLLQALGKSGRSAAALRKEYEAFVCDLVLEGLRPRQPDSAARPGRRRKSKAP